MSNSYAEQQQQQQRQQQQQQQQQYQKYHLFYRLKNCCSTKLTNEQYVVLCENLLEEYDRYFNYCFNIYSSLFLNEI